MINFQFLWNCQQWIWYLNIIVLVYIIDVKLLKSKTNHYLTINDLFIFSTHYSIDRYSSKDDDQKGRVFTMESSPTNQTDDIEVYWYGNVFDLFLHNIHVFI